MYSYNIYIMLRHQVIGLYSAYSFSIRCTTKDWNIFLHLLRTTRTTRLHFENKNYPVAEGLIIWRNSFRVAPIKQARQQ